MKPTIDLLRQTCYLPLSITSEDSLPEQVDLKEMTYGRAYIKRADSVIEIREKGVVKELMESITELKVEHSVILDIVNQLRKLSYLKDDESEIISRVTDLIREIFYWPIQNIEELFSELKRHSQKNLPDSQKNILTKFSCVLSYSVGYGNTQNERETLTRYYPPSFEESFVLWVLSKEQ